jgi:hypothetical protein
VSRSHEWVLERIRHGAIAVHRWGVRAEGRPLYLASSAGRVLCDRHALPPQYGDQV